MTSFERLVASDPQRAGAYAPRDLDAMISRVLAQPVARVLSWRAFKARVLAGFTASCAVMAAATYALAGAGPSLARLTFAAAPVKASVAPTFAATATVTGTGEVAAAPKLLTGAISSAVPSLAAYSVTTPSSEHDVVATLAAALGVTLGPPRTVIVAPPAARQEWTTRVERGTEAIIVRVGGVDLWDYGPVLSAQSPALPPVVAAPNAPGTLGAPALAQRALDIVRALGTYDTGVPIVGAGTFVRGEPTNVVVPILVNGHWSNLTDNFVLDARGRVFSARGVMFSLGPPVNYPNISPRAAVAHVSAQAAIFAHGVTSWGWPGYQPSGSALPTGTLHLIQSSAQYRLLVDAGGVAHALPIYQYVGRSSGAREVVVDALAIDPRYLVYEVHGSSP